jgi:CRP/FNR family transcriptional regulator, cyclic AMP receptor protein
VKATPPTREQALRVMERHGWLSRRPAPFREEVVRRSRLRTFRQGQSLYNAGDPPMGMVGVVAGQMRLQLPPAETIGSIAAIGQWVGDATAFMQAPRWVSMTAGSTLHVLHLPQAAFEAMIEQAENCRHFAINTAEALAEAVTVIANLLQPDSEIRVAQRLLTFLGLHGTDRHAGIDIAQADLATLCGLSRQTLNKVLTTLEARNIIRCSYRRIEVADPQALRALAFHDERAWR